MVEGGHLGDHPANADAGEVRRPAAERIDKGRGVGGEVPKCVRGLCGSVVVDVPLSRRS
jgi:hypothetical protein